MAVIGQTRCFEIVSKGSAAEYAEQPQQQYDQEDGANRYAVCAIGRLVEPAAVTPDNEDNEDDEKD